MSRSPCEVDRSVLTCWYRTTNNNNRSRSQFSGNDNPHRESPSSRPSRPLLPSPRCCCCDDSRGSLRPASPRLTKDSFRRSSLFRERLYTSISPSVAHPSRSLSTSIAPQTLRSAKPSREEYRLPHSSRIYRTSHMARRRGARKRWTTSYSTSRGHGGRRRRARSRWTP